MHILSKSLSDARWGRAQRIKKRLLRYLFEGLVKRAGARQGGQERRMRTYVRDTSAVMGVMRHRWLVIKARSILKPVFIGMVHLKKIT